MEQLPGPVAAGLYFILGLALGAVNVAQADINIGLTLSTTGPAASLGIPERNTVALLPSTIGGEKINYIVLDDASDAATALANTRRLIDDRRVDAIIGASITPNALAMVDAIAGSETPMLVLAASARSVEPLDDRRAWVFKTAPSEAPMVAAIVRHMRDQGRRRLAFIGFADAYGDNWWSAFAASVGAARVALVARETFQGTDTAVGPQVARILAAWPDAVLIAASGTPAALPHKALRAGGYVGTIYHTPGVANPDFLRVGGRDLDGTLLPAGPVLVAAQLPNDHPVRKTALRYVDKYEGRHGKGSASPFGAHLWDAGLLLEQAIPEALRIARPGTPNFRRALRNAIEGVRNLVGANGVFSMSERDHNGFDPRFGVMVTIDKGLWRLVGEASDRPRTSGRR